MTVKICIRFRSSQLFPSQSSRWTISRMFTS